MNWDKKWLLTQYHLLIQLENQQEGTWLRGMIGTCNKVDIISHVYFYLYDPRPCYLMFLNNKFLAGLIGFVPAHLPQSHSLHYAHASSAVAVLSVDAIFVKLSFIISNDAFWQMIWDFLLVFFSNCEQILFKIVVLTYRALADSAQSYVYVAHVADVPTRLDRTSRWLPPPPDSAILPSHNSRQMGLSNFRRQYVKWTATWRHIYTVTLCRQTASQDISIILFISEHFHLTGYIMMWT